MFFENMKVFPCLLLLLILSCSIEEDRNIGKRAIEEPSIYTQYSNSKNEYLNFNSVKAINRIADIENEYFQNVRDSVSRYYGTVWREGAERIMVNDSVSQYEMYLEKLSPEISKPDSLHCTLYAYEGLKAGLTKEQLTELEKYHRDIWKSREIAGWSIGFILVKYFDWKAYLFLNPNSNEYEHCLKSFNRNKSYPVWKQPDIPLEKMFIIGQEDSLINNLLLEHEFTWGFSEQGIHTWITRFNELKECNWLGAPALIYQSHEFEKPLFLSTDFNEYFDYSSHVIVVPRKLDKSVHSE